ncbi:unnamed protein product [Soboliphyme baturini]|uniref:Uncharacterized protein n=1 Tax=Soboliphyme baturini TaxID=241478 RepID=A0A183INR7_9BILA|nr:unnamed protein product [Soboliphyme baturini]
MAVVGRGSDILALRNSFVAGWPSHGRLNFDPICVPFSNVRLLHVTSRQRIQPIFYLLLMSTRHQPSSVAHGNMFSRAARHRSDRRGNDSLLLSDIRYLRLMSSLPTAMQANALC